MLPLYIEVFLVGLLAGISPGPDFFVVMRNSLSFGTRVGLYTAGGIAAALSVHIFYTIMGFTLLLASYPQVFQAVQFAGAGYLAYLGLAALRAKASAGPDGGREAGQMKNPWRGFRDGFFCNVLNPKATVFFLSIFAQFLTPGMPQQIKWIYGLEIMAAVGGWFALLSVLISSERFRAVYYRQEVTISRLLGLVLLYFTARIICGLFY